MKQIAVRIGGFVVNAGSQTIVLDRNVDVEKSNARSGNFPGKLESRMKSIDKLDESVELRSATLTVRRSKKCRSARSPSSFGITV